MHHHMHSSDWPADSEQADSEAGTWMSTLGEADLPPTQVLMHHSLAAPVQEQVGSKHVSACRCEMGGMSPPPANFGTAQPG